MRCTIAKLASFSIILIIAQALASTAFGQEDRTSLTAPKLTLGTASYANLNEKTNAKASVLDFTMKSIDGKETPLANFKGNVLLIVNVASKCGYTPQYEGLQAIYSKYKDQGFVVLGFPANNFLGQEPGTDEEIKTFCTLKYNVTFPMFSKISVKGENIHPLYRFLTSKETNPELSGDISWNFNKFLVNRDGKVIARFGTKEKPESEKVLQAIEQALKK
jgi:glutathione peroxidase